MYIPHFCPSPSSLSLSSDEDDEDEEEEEDDEDDDEHEEEEEEEELDPEREQEEEEEDDEEEDLDEQDDRFESESELEADPRLLIRGFLEVRLGVSGSVLAATIRLSASGLTTGLCSPGRGNGPLLRPTASTLSFTDSTAGKGASSFPSSSFTLTSSLGLPLRS